MGDTRRRRRRVAVGVGVGVGVISVGCYWCCCCSFCFLLLVVLLFSIHVKLMYIHSFIHSTLTKTWFEQGDLDRAPRFDL